MDAPADLEAAIEADDAAARRWAQLTASHRREYLEWIDGAKRADTRERRIARAVELLRDDV